MKRLLETTSLMLPERGWMYAYWLAALALILLVSLGLKAEGDHGALWGIPLGDGFGGSSAKAIENAYLEMTRHVWLLLTLPMTCFVAHRKILDTFRSDFRQFLRFSRSTVLFVEAARLAAVATVLTTLIAPLAVAIGWGCYKPGIGLAGMRDGLVSCVAPTGFVTLLIYLLVSLQIPQDVAKACGLVMPFFLTLIGTYLGRMSHHLVNRFVPPGLPYDVDHWNNPHVLAGLIFCALVASYRLVFAALRWSGAKPRPGR